MTVQTLAIVVLLVSFFVMIFLRFPIAYAVGLSSVLCLMVQGQALSDVCRLMVKGISSFSLMAVPFFITMGVLMGSGGISEKLIALADACVGWMRGGMAMVNIVASYFFGGISGSASADTASIGSIMIPMMVSNGYNKYYATGLTCCAGGLGVIVPPSYPMVLYGVTCNVSVGKLFIAGLGPAFVVGGLLMLINYVMCKRWGIKGDTKLELKNIASSFWDAKWALIMPVIILGGIYSGIFTATEAAVVASVYGIVIGLFVHRELKLEKLWAIFRDNAAFIAGTMFVMAPSKATGQVFAYLNITKIIANFMFSISTNPYIVLCMIFVIMFIVGMFVQTTPAIVILAPTLLAVVTQVGIDPIHFGIIMTLALAIAFVTPPVALNLFVGSSMTGLSIDKIVKAFMPFLIGLIVAFFIVSFVPAISLGVLGDWSLTFG